MTTLQENLSTIRMSPPSENASVLVLNFALNQYFVYEGETEVKVYDFDGNHVLSLDTPKNKWHAKEAIREYIMDRLGIDKENPPEVLPG
jgi:hypothetical protein